MDYIEQILSDKNKNKSEKWISENFSTFHSFINSLFSLDISWKEKLYLHINSLDTPPNCYCGKNVHFINITKGYRKYCSTYCLSNDSLIKQKKKETCVVKYGVD